MTLVQLLINGSNHIALQCEENPDKLLKSIRFLNYYYPLFFTNKMQLVKNGFMEPNVRKQPEAQFKLGQEP